MSTRCKAKLIVSCQLSVHASAWNVLKNHHHFRISHDRYHTWNALLFDVGLNSSHLHTFDCNNCEEKKAWLFLGDYSLHIFKIYNISFEIWISYQHKKSFVLSFFFFWSILSIGLPFGFLQQVRRCFSALATKYFVLVFYIGITTIHY